MTTTQPLEGMTVTELAEMQKARDLDVSQTVGLADAFVFQVDHGAGTPFTLTEAIDATADLFAAVKRADLPSVVAYLACQVAGYRRSESADARLALSQMETVVDRWREHHRPDPCLGCNRPLVRRSGKLVHRDGDPDRCSPPAGTAPASAAVDPPAGTVHP